MNNQNGTRTTCVLGATGIIGFELTAHLLAKGENVLAVIRNEAKLHQKLGERSITGYQENLTVLTTDLFADDALDNPDVKQQLQQCTSIVNCASPAPLSLVPWSSTNRSWGDAVSKLTKKIVALGASAEHHPHVLAFCGPEYFKDFDGTAGPLSGLLSAITRSLSAGLRDNHIEVRFLLGSTYSHWTVLRCGSIRNASGQAGDGTKVDMDLHKNKSNYSQGKGKSLIVEDLAAFLTELISSGKISTLKKEMPFLFNTRF